MTALVDIGKSHMTVAALRGSDLTEFNESHPRDEAGRFARVASGPRKDDPRIAREARRKRRQRRGLAEIVGQRVEAARQALNASSLQSLRRERVLPERRVQAVVDPRVKEKAKAPAKEKAKPQTKEIVLTDESHGNASEGTTDVDNQVLIPVTRQQFDEFLSAGAMNVGAANKKWHTSLIGHMTEGDEQSVASRVLREQLDFRHPFRHDTVLLRINQRFRSTSSGEDQESFALASAHVLTPTFDQPKTGMNVSDFHFVHERPGGITPDDDYAPPSGQQVMLPVVDVDVSKSVSVMDWDEDEHPRDPDTGQFMRLHVGPGGPPGPGDPRAARARRLRRRQGRAMAEAAFHDARTHEPEERETPRLVRDPRARIYAPVVIEQREAPKAEEKPEASVRVPLREVGKPTEEVEPEPKVSLRAGRPKFSSAAYSEGGTAFAPAAASEGLPDIGSPSKRALKRIRPTYDPVERDPDTGRVIMPPLSTPARYVDPEIREEFVAWRRDVLSTHQARKAAKKTP